jgi:hypothetical protein
MKQVLIGSQGGSSTRFVLAAAVVAALTGGVRGATFTYSRAAGNTAATADLWSAGTNWNAVPVSDAATQLLFKFPTTLGSGQSMFTTNDLGTLTLNSNGTGAVTNNSLDAAGTLTLGGLQTGTNAAGLTINGKNAAATARSFAATNLATGRSRVATTAGSGAASAGRRPSR